MTMAESITTYDTRIRRVFKQNKLLLVLLCNLPFLSFTLKHDKLLAEYLAKINLTTCHHFLTIMTYGGDGLIIICPLLLGILSRYFFKNPATERVAWFVAISIILSGIACILLKILFGRARPELWIYHQIYGFYWLQFNPSYWSFPSGHATTLMSIAFALSFLYPHKKTLFFVLASPLVITRILLFQHFLSDIIAATIISFVETTFLYHYLNNKQFFNTQPFILSR